MKTNNKLQNLQNDYNLMRGSTFAISIPENQLEANACSIRDDQVIPSQNLDKSKIAEDIELKSKEIKNTMRDLSSRGVRLFILFFRVLKKSQLSDSNLTQVSKT